MLAAADAAREAFRLAQAGRLEEAVVLAERAVAGAQICLPGHGFLASLLLRLGRADDAEAVVVRAQDLAPGVADAYDGLANVSMALGRHDRANALYRRATQVEPRDPRFWYNLACSERSLGSLVEAEAACDRGIALDAAAYPTYLLRSELRVQGPAVNHIDELQAQLGRAAADYRARVFLGYALGKELDDVGRFDEAFHCFAAAAKARRSRLEYDVATDERKLRRIAEVYTRELCVPSPPAGRGAHPPVDSARHIFIVGLPRSGTTLVERILTGLPGVRSNGETDNFSRALLDSATSRCDGRYVFQVPPRRIRGRSGRVTRTGRPARRSAATIEKLPINYLYIGAIHARSERGTCC